MLSTVVILLVLLVPRISKFGLLLSLCSSLLKAQFLTVLYYKRSSTLSHVLLSAHKPPLTVSHLVVPDERMRNDDFFKYCSLK